ncbi:MAG TPA: YHS domain-containing protein [Tepidisphaeraceae bacterium]|nr:YHS domain-containing protein [Tepidisphaeraceae bacterium]
MSNTNRFAVACVFASIAALCGCADESQTVARGPTTAPIAAMTSPRAQCLVCKYNADLACLDVDVDQKTPSYVYQGKTYYFCSQECHDEFAKHPQRYAPLASK